MRSDIRARDNAPPRAVPVLDESALYVAVVSGGTHGPNVARRDGCHTIKKVVIRSNIRTWNYTPVPAVPVLDQRVDHTIVTDEFSHRPDVIRGDGSCL